jgi:hypothetical protein
LSATGKKEPVDKLKSEVNEQLWKRSNSKLRKYKFKKTDLI